MIQIWHASISTRFQPVFVGKLNFITQNERWERTTVLNIYNVINWWKKEVLGLVIQVDPPTRKRQEQKSDDANITLSQFSERECLVGALLFWIQVIKNKVKAQNLRYLWNNDFRYEYFRDDVKTQIKNSNKRE